MPVAAPSTQVMDTDDGALQVGLLSYVCPCYGCALVHVLNWVSVVLPEAKVVCKASPRSPGTDLASEPRLVATFLSHSGHPPCWPHVAHDSLHVSTHG